MGRRPIPDDARTGLAIRHPAPLRPPPVFETVHRQAEDVFQLRAMLAEQAETLSRLLEAQRLVARAMLDLADRLERGVPA
jgi:hypothetical protein